MGLHRYNIQKCQLDSAHKVSPEMLKSYKEPFWIKNYFLARRVHWDFQIFPFSFNSRKTVLKGLYSIFLRGFHLYLIHYSNMETRRGSILDDEQQLNAFIVLMRELVLGQEESHVTRNRLNM